MKPFKVDGGNMLLVFYRLYFRLDKSRPDAIGWGILNDGYMLEWRHLAGPFYLLVK